LKLGVNENKQIEYIKELMKENMWGQETSAIA